MARSIRCPTFSVSLTLNEEVETVCQTFSMYVVLMTAMLPPLVHDENYAKLRVT